MNDPLHLTVLGTGYLGTTHAACMASLGFDVLGVDTDARKVDLLNAGQLPIYEPGLRELLHSGVDSGRLAFTTSYPRAAAFGDVHFICAGTPPQPASDHADLSQVHGCVAALAPLLDRPCLVVGKSTVPVGTARRLAAELADACRGVELAWNPEFLREGSAVADALAPDRIVAGVTSPWPKESSDRCTLGQSPTAPRFSPRSWRPPSWPRWRRTPSWPRRSLSSMRWRRYAKPPEETSMPYRGSSAQTRASARRSCALGSASAEAACRRTSARSSPGPLIWVLTRHSASCARWTLSTCGGGQGRPISPASWPAGISPTCRVRARRRIQARLR
jgi:UDP-glucose/GDP-mannose dehydrogenase family, NAD binding domain